MSKKMYDFTKFAKDATYFSKGDEVTANTSVQGMQKGHNYTITDVDEKRSPFGNIVYYQLDGKLWVANAHLLLSKDMATDPPVSEAQRRAMFAAKSGKSNIGIPQKVGAEFAKADPGGKLPARKR